MLRRQIARGGELDRRQLDRALATMEAQAIRVTVLVDQLLSASRIEGGQLNLALAPTDLVALVRRIADTTSLVDEGRHPIRVMVPEQEIMAEIDPVRVEQVLTNLTGHACKYSPPGNTVDVEVRREAGFAVLSVRDRGDGVPLEDRPFIFDRYFRAKNSSQKTKGLGLGLYISHQIVRQHGGDIFAQFPEEGGSCFVVRFPTMPLGLPEPSAPPLGRPEAVA
jgi:signal transduction histidine kinase